MKGEHTLDIVDALDIRQYGILKRRSQKFTNKKTRCTGVDLESSTCILR